jgi:hypothetical protein
VVLVVVEAVAIALLALLVATIPVTGGAGGVATGTRAVWVTNPEAATVTGLAVGRR